MVEAAGSEQQFEGTVMAQLRQKNMILEAEKQNLQSELLFYKNQLAKMCLKEGIQFPIYRPSTVAGTPEKTSCSGATSSSQISNRNSTHIISDLATPAVSISPHMFY